MTKLQTGIACALLATAPLVVQQRAFSAARREAQTLVTEAQRWQTAAESAAAANAALRRQADRYRADRRQWERERTLGATIAANRGGAELAALYRWDDAEDFARLPKSILGKVAIREWESNASPGAERDTSAPISPDGTPASLLLEVLGLDPAQQIEVAEYCRAFFQAYRSQAQARSRFLTEIPAGVSPAHIRPQAELRLRLTPALTAEESKALRDSFRNGLAQHMGAGPAAGFWEQIGDVLDHQCDDFGSFTRLLGARRTAAADTRPEDQWILIRMHHEAGSWRWDGEVPGTFAGLPELVAELAAGPAVTLANDPNPSQP